MTINSLFIIATNDLKVFMEKHWCSAIKRSVLDDFLEQLRGLSDVNDMPIVFLGPNNHYLVHILHNDTIFLAVTREDVMPLMITEFLHRIKDVFIDYFGECSVNSIKENFVVVYSLLDELLDAGFPLVTEPNVLKELIRPTTMLSSIKNTVTGKSNVSENLPSGQLSNVPWRKANVKYNNNEAYFDMKENLNMVINKQGSHLLSLANGRIDSSIKLSGTPDLSLSWQNPKVFNNVNFHPCIRLKRWNMEKMLSFIPPDGQFELLRYQSSINGAAALPFNIRANASLQAGKIDISISPKRLVSPKPVMNVVVTCKMPACVTNVNLNASEGSYSFDSFEKRLKWEVGKLVSGTAPSLRGSINLKEKSDLRLVFSVQFSVEQYAASNIKVHQLNVFGEGYKAFKGVKYITSANAVEVRT
ncbi:unnamed protein product [Oikopleura dioica]|uniref:MHD domain-containing protein n=1 Tax=Oikopleura dioica TaxID=34765 RepID=E4XQA7_OIKDI|nr:unnamed protein product [Oikopleura dioica]